MSVQVQEIAVQAPRTIVADAIQFREYGNCVVILFRALPWDAKRAFLGNGPLADSDEPMFAHRNVKIIPNPVSPPSLALIVRSGG